MARPLPVYIYAPNADDFDTAGLCGALMPTKCEADERAGGAHELSIEHSLDKWGKWKYIVTDAIIKANVPVRTTPEIRGSTVVTQVVSAEVLSTATKVQRYIYTKVEGGKKRKLLPVGTVVTVVENPADKDRYKIKSSKYGTGWVTKAALKLFEPETILPDPESIEEVEPAWSVREQLFRIYDYERADTGIKAKARHISYDLLGNMTNYENDETLTCQTALDGILENTTDPHDFKAYTDINETRVGVSWPRVNPIKALLDPETGLMKRWGAQLVRDDWELFFLSRAGLNRGVRIEYGKNLKSVQCSVTFANIITKILPVGQDKDGKPIYLSSDPDKPSSEITDASYVVSGRASLYQAPHILVLDVDDAVVNSKKGGKEVTPALACERMRQAAQEQFENGVDLPEINITVDFIELGKTQQYSKYAELETVFLYDTVKVHHKSLNITESLDVVHTVFDCIRGRYTKTELGTIRDTITTSLATWQIPTISGGKISLGSLGSGAFENEFISARMIQAGTIVAQHIAANSIYTDALQAGCITADKMSANSLIAQHLVAQIADIIQANINKADIGQVHIDYADIVNLDALYANIANAQIGKADVGWAQIKDLVTQKAIITQGIGDQLFISRLAVTEANMVSLTTGELVVKGDDGRFYAITVDDEGNVTPVLKQVGNDDVADRSIMANTKIIEGSITAAELNVTQIFASQALIGAITAANIAVGTITPAHVTSDFGATLDISSNKAIRSIVNADTVRQMIADSTRELRVTYNGAGTHFTSDDDTTTMSAYVYASGFDITGTIPEAAFIWSRDSGDTDADNAWNLQHVGTRTVTITKSDAVNRSIIECTLLSVEDMTLAFYADPDTQKLTVIDPPHGMDTATYDPLTGKLTIDGTGYIYDQLEQTITIDSTLSASRTTVQFTFSDETGIRSLILQTESLILLQVENELADQRAAIEIELGSITATVQGQEEEITQVIQTTNSLSTQVASKASISYVDQTASSLSSRITTAQNTADSKVSYSEMIQTLNSFTFTLKDSSVSASFSAKIALNQWTSGYDGTTKTFGVGIGMYDGSNLLGGLSSLYGDIELASKSRLYLNGTGEVGLNVLPQAGYTGAYSTSINGYGFSAKFTNDEGPVFVFNTFPAVRPSTSGSMTLGTSAYRWGTIYGIGAVNTSDPRVKRDMKPLNAADLLDRLNPIRFYWIDELWGTKLNFGLDARAVGEAIQGTDYEDAELYRDEDPDNLYLNYTNLIPVLIEGWQAHEATIEKQNKKIHDLESRIARLESLLGV